MSPAEPAPVVEPAGRGDSSVSLHTQDVVEVCGAPAWADAVLRRCGRPLEAGRMGEVFSLAESALAGWPAGAARAPAQPAGASGASDAGSNSMDSELTQ